MISIVALAAFMQVLRIADNPSINRICHENKSFDLCYRHHSPDDGLTGMFSG
jgi:hypothetical protein